jgi:DNA-binding NtrC family response regulator
MHAAVARVEKDLIQRALVRAGGNRSAAARLLGIGRPQLYAKMEEHGLGGRGADES